jgi:hypothetical protein
MIRCGWHNQMHDQHIKAYDGQVADEDGYFDGPEGRVIGPPIGFGCRCRVVLRKKQA